jgi:acetyl esterase/lipase
MRGWVQRIAIGVAIAVASLMIALINGFVPFTGYVLRKDEAYGTGDRRSLDVYLPKTESRDRTIIVFFYGGSWQSGSKEMYRFVGQAFAARGFVTVIPDYRVYPEVRYPGFVDDAAQSVAWARSHAASLGGDPHRIFLIGHSAGAYIAAMLAYDPTWLGKVGLDPKRDVSAMVGLAGPYDFLPLKDPTLMEIFGPTATRDATQPINHVSPGAPPAFLVAGSADKLVDPGNSTRLADRLKEAGDSVQTAAYPGIGHIELLLSIAWPLRFRTPVLSDVDTYLKGRLTIPTDQTVREAAQ